MQYTFTFHVKGISYTLVASRYAQARLHFKKVITASYVVVYGGRYHGPAVRNGKCIAVSSI